MKIFILTDVFVSRDNEVCTVARVFKTREEARQKMIDCILNEFQKYFKEENTVKTEEDMWERFGKWESPSDFWIGDNHYSYVIHEHEV